MVGDTFVINGTTMFISHADRADFIILFASTDRSLGAKGISCFLVDKNTLGVSLSREIPTMGDDWSPHEILFDNAAVGGINEGWRIANDQLSPSGDTFTSVKDLTAAIETFVDGWNDRCEPFVWTKTADQILIKANRQTTSETAR